MPFYFQLQYRRYERTAKYFGTDPVLGVILLTITFIGVSFWLLSHQWGAYLYILLGISAVYSNIGTLRFKQLTCIYPSSELSKLRLVENLVIASIFALGLILRNEWMLSISLILLSAVLSYIPLPGNIALNIPSPFPNPTFESNKGWRQSFGLFIVLYSLVFKSWQVDNFNLGFFSLCIMTLLIVSFYSKIENQHFLSLEIRTPHLFLINKLTSAIVSLLIISLPASIFIIVAFPLSWKLLLFFYLMSIVLITAIILSKYSNYPFEISVNEGFMFAISFAFPPFLIFMMYRFYLSSLDSLKTYLNDTN